MQERNGVFFVTAVMIIALAATNTSVNCQDIVSDEESSPDEDKGDGTLNAMKAGPTEEPKTRPCNSCEMENCRRNCKVTCRPCQYNFCHVDEGEYNCKCLRTPPSAATAEAIDADERVRRSARVPRYVPPRKGRRIRNCHK